MLDKIPAYLVLFLVLYILQRTPWFKFRPDESVDYESLGEGYKSYEFRTYILFFILTFALGGLCWFFGGALLRVLRANHPPSDFMIFDDTVMIIVPSAIWGFFIAAHLTMGLLYVFYGKEQVKCYYIYSEYEWKLRNKPMIILMYSVGLPAACLTAIMCYDFYFRIDSKGIYVNDFWSYGEKAYSIKEIEGLSIAKEKIPHDDHWHEKIQYLAAFDDGTSMPIPGAGFRADESLAMEMMEHLSDLTQISIEVTEVTGENK